MLRLAFIVRAKEERALAGQSRARNESSLHQGEFLLSISLHNINHRVSENCNHILFLSQMDADVVASGQCDGTTACACAIVGSKVICSNVGDSRAIIVKRDGTAVALSEDHKPDRGMFDNIVLPITNFNHCKNSSFDTVTDDETKRINDLGGRVIHWGRWRVEGVLAVSRSIGDARLKPFVSADPDIVEHDICEQMNISTLMLANIVVCGHPLTSLSLCIPPPFPLGEDDMFLVVASDGVWDTMSNDLVAKFVLVNTCRIVNKSLLVGEFIPDSYVLQCETS